MTSDAERLASLATAKYVRLTTYRQDGTEASTPVWVVSDDGRRLLVWTGAGTWKVRRIRRDPRVRVAPSDARGKPRGEPVDGTARLLGSDADELVQGLLRRKYWLVKPALDVFDGLMGKLSRKPRAGSEYIEIVPRANP